MNIPTVGIRPRFASPGCGECTKCLPICPGYSVDARRPTEPAATVEGSGAEEFGPSLELWEGYACDSKVRFKASSGGLLSAIAQYCLEHEGMRFVLHTGADPEQPWLNRTVKSTNRAELLSRSGSRYAPSSPCGDLQDVEASDGECVFIGKPCDAAAVDMLVRQRPQLEKKLGLILTFFCAGTPSTEGTLDLLTSLNVDLDSVDGVRYRGEGWPGRFNVRYGADNDEKSLSYADSWGRLTAYRPLRCNLCPDGLGRLADLACGDAWARFSAANDPGRSIVIVRTERGRRILHAAMAAKYVKLEPVDSRAVLASQQHLLQRRRELYGRLLGMRLLGVPTPKFLGFSLVRSWIRQPLSIQARSVLGTMRRCLQRGKWRRTTALTVDEPARG